MAHKRLFEGEEGSPDNYLLVLADERSDYFSPRHRHAWDQLRYCLHGAVPIARGLAVEAGEIGYFPEGGYYGPQEGGPDRIELLLQFGGASGQGYIGADRLRAAREEMAAFGRFEKGVFTRSEPGGRKHQDAYEAIWEHVTGRRIVYPEPAYKTPVIIRPAGFVWQAIGPGLLKKEIAYFPHRGLAVALLSIDAGRRWQGVTDETLKLLFVIEGKGSAGGESYRSQAAMRLAPGEQATIVAASRTELLLLAIAPIASLAR
jgi:hypothetical protein